MSGIRFFTTADIDRPSFSVTGDRVYASVVSGVPFSTWDRRRKSVLGGAGELLAVTAIGFFPAGTDVAERDRVTALGAAYEVVTVVSGHDDRGIQDHIGVELVDI